MKAAIKVLLLVVVWVQRPPRPCHLPLPCPADFGADAAHVAPAVSTTQETCAETAEGDPGDDPCMKIERRFFLPASVPFGDHYRITDECVHR